jgi:hypothetical protein
MSLPEDPAAGPEQEGETLVTRTASRSPTLPFTPPRAPVRSGETRELRIPDGSPTLPFPPHAAVFDVDTYAELHVELLLEPGARDRVLARFGISSEGAYSDVVRSFRARFAADAGLRERWLERSAEVRRELLDASGARRSGRTP